MNKIEFNTQIATTIEQSKRLLELGLKKETADCIITQKVDGTFDVFNTNCGLLEVEIIKDASKLFVSFSAWSLHRLITMLPLKIEDDYSQESFLKIEGYNIVYKERDIFIYNSFEKNNIYDNIIDCIEWLIEDGYFNRDYLK